MYIVVRSTIHLPGLPRGHEALVDATSEYIQGLIEAQWLVPVGADDEMGWGE